jgi:hypothetical protein
MTKNLANIRIYGDQDSVVYLAPKGTTLPVDLAAPAAAFQDLGWLSEDGVDITRESSSTDFTAWQGGTIVRSKVSGVKDTIKVVCLEETAIALGLLYPGSTSTTTAGLTKISVPGGANSNEKAMVVDFIDDDVTKRYAIARAEVTGTGTISHKNTDMTMYEFTFTIYGNFEIISNNPALASA